MKLLKILFIICLLSSCLWADTLSNETSNNTSAYSSFTGFVNGDEAATNVSQTDLHNFYWPGTNIAVLVEGWFCGAPNVSTINFCNGHVEVGYNSNNNTQVANQVTDMNARGVNVIVFDWGGENSWTVGGNTVTNTAPTDINATMAKFRDATGAPKLVTLYNQAAFSQCATANLIYTSDSTTVVPKQVCIAQIMQQDFSYLDTNFWGNAVYFKYLGRPVVVMFIDETAYPTVDWTAVYDDVMNQSYTNGPPLLLWINSTGFFHQRSDGAYAWPNNWCDMKCALDIGVPYLEQYYQQSVQGTAASSQAAVISAPSPTITNISRHVGSAGGGVGITITGTNFTADTKVTFGSTKAYNVVVGSATSLSCNVPAHTTGVVDVHVITGGGTATASSAFDYEPAPSQLTTVDYPNVSFEDGTIGNFQYIRDGKNTSYCTTDATYSAFGAYSAKCHLDNSVLTYPPDYSGVDWVNIGTINPSPSHSTNGVYFRFYAYVPVAFAAYVQGIANSEEEFVSTEDPYDPTHSFQHNWLYCGIGNNLSSIVGGFGCRFSNDSTISGGDTGVNIADGHWHEFEIWLHRTGGVGTEKIWIDGTLVFNQSSSNLGQDTGANPAINVRYLLGYTALSGGHNNNVGAQNGFIWIDSPEVSTGFIDPPGNGVNPPTPLALYTVGSQWKGYDDSIAPWTTNSSILQNCGQTWLLTSQTPEWAGSYSQGYPLPFVLIASWNDYEDGTEIETGVDNCAALTASVASNTLTWTINPSANTNTIDHFTVWDSTDGVNLTLIQDNIPPTQTAINLADYTISSGTYKLYVKAQGLPSYSNYMSNAVSWTTGGTSGTGSPPTITLTVQPTTGGKPLTVIATMVVTDSGNDVVQGTASFNWGDNTAPSVGQYKATHTYPGVGTFTVLASVADQGGYLGTASQAVVVTATSQSPPPSVILSITPSGNVGPPPVSISATVAYTGLHAGIPTIAWGDGNITVASSGSHTYTLPGLYTISATSCNTDDGLCGSDFQTILVGNPTYTNNVAINGLAFNQQVYSPLRINATVTSGNGNMDTVKIFQDGVLVYTAVPNALYYVLDKYLIMPVGGTHTIQVQAHNVGGNTYNSTLITGIQIVGVSH